MSNHDPKLPKDAKTQFAAGALITPSIVAVVLHLARMAAQADYKHYCETGRIPYDEPEGGSP